MAPGPEVTPLPTPHCAICGGDSAACGHEDDRLRRALDEAQERWQSGEQMRAIRHWVLMHAREMILQTYRGFEAQRRSQYEAHLVSIPFYNLWQIYQDGAPLPQPQLANLKNQMYQAYEHMHRTLDTDWQNCLKKYPETLDYYFQLVSMEAPEEQDVRVEYPMISNGEKKPPRGKGKRGGFRGIPPMAANTPTGGYGRYAAGMPPGPSPSAGPFPGYQY